MKEITLRTTGTKKTYMYAQILLYCQPNRQRKRVRFVQEILNMNLLLVNNFLKPIKLQFHTPATAFGQNLQVLCPSFIDSATHDQIIKEFSECTSNKVSFYLFEIKEECY